MGIIIVPHRRRREGKTDYRQRLKLLKSGKPRFVVRRSLKNVYCQIVVYKKDGDQTLASSSSKQLKKYGWTADCGNLPAAYLTGLLCAVDAKKKNVPSAILDAGLYTSVKGSRLYSTLKGAVDGGLDIPHNESALPDKERLTGAHIAAYAQKLKKEKPTQYKKQFSAHINSKISPEDLPKMFEAAKQKILSSAK